jgi:hypothetical protein
MKELGMQASALWPVKRHQAPVSALLLGSLL